MSGSSDWTEDFLRTELAGGRFFYLILHEYRLWIRADIVLKKTWDGKILLEKSVRGKATFVPGSDLTTARQKALPDAARDLAHEIVESVVEYW